MTLEPKPMAPGIKSPCFRVIRWLPVAAGFLFLFAVPVMAQSTIVEDDDNVAGDGTGFVPGSGVNFGILPPATGRRGVAAANLRYIPTATKTEAAFGIAAAKLTVTPAEKAQVETSPSP